MKQLVRLIIGFSVGLVVLTGCIPPPFEHGHGDDHGPAQHEEHAHGPDHAQDDGRDFH